MELKDAYYKIYQVDIEEKFAFRDWKRIKKFNLNWSFKPYKSVWSGFTKIKDDYDILEHLFAKFNLNPPFGFKGHSMSVSDIIKINHTTDEDKAKYYFCDARDWKDITNEVKRE